MHHKPTWSTSVVKWLLIMHLMWFQYCGTKGEQPLQEVSLFNLRKHILMNIFINNVQITPAEVIPMNLSTTVGFFFVHYLQHAHTYTILFSQPQIGKEVGPLPEGVELLDAEGVSGRMMQNCYLSVLPFTHSHIPLDSRGNTRLRRSIGCTTRDLS